MRKKWLLVTSAMCALPLLVALFLGRPWEREPRYQGRPLSYWLAHNNDPKVEAALDHIGTNALPFLLKWIRYERPHWRNVLFEKAPSSLEKFTISGAELRANASGVAIAYLGTNAAAALPELTTLARDTNAPETAIRATWALASIGPGGIQPLLAIARDTNNPNGDIVMAALGTAVEGPFPPLKVAALAELTGESNPPAIRELSLRSLGDLVSIPALALPPLIHSFTNAAPDSVIWITALSAIRSFGADATNILPVLTNALMDPSPRVRLAASNTINTIVHPELFPAFVH